MFVAFDSPNRNHLCSEEPVVRREGEITGDLINIWALLRVFFSISENESDVTKWERSNGTLNSGHGMRG